MATVLLAAAEAMMRAALLGEHVAVTTLTSSYWRVLQPLLRQNPQSPEAWEAVVALCWVTLALQAVLGCDACGAVLPWSVCAAYQDPPARLVGRGLEVALSLGYRALAGDEVSEDAGRAVQALGSPALSAPVASTERARLRARPPSPRRRSRSREIRRGPEGHGPLLVCPWPSAAGGVMATTARIDLRDRPERKALTVGLLPTHQLLRAPAMLEAPALEPWELSGHLSHDTAATRRVVLLEAFTRALLELHHGLRPMVRDDTLEQLEGGLLACALWDHLPTLHGAAAAALYQTLTPKWATLPCGPSKVAARLQLALRGATDPKLDPGGGWLDVYLKTGPTALAQHVLTETTSKASMGTPGLPAALGPLRLTWPAWAGLTPASLATRALQWGLWGWADQGRGQLPATQRLRLQVAEHLVLAHGSVLRATSAPLQVLGLRAVLLAGFLETYQSGDLAYLSQLGGIAAGGLLGPELPIALARLVSQRTHRPGEREDFKKGGPVSAFLALFERERAFIPPTPPQLSVPKSPPAHGACSGRARSARGG